MSSFLDRATGCFWSGPDWLVGALRAAARATRWPGAASALALILLLSVNLFAASTLRNAKADLTQQRLFTISDGTRGMLRAIDEPINVRLYFSKRLGEAAPTYARYFERVRALLQQYGDISGGRLELERVRSRAVLRCRGQGGGRRLARRAPQPGGRGRLLRPGRHQLHGHRATIPFFTTDREAFLEYDLTKLIYSLSNPKKRVVGLMTGLPLDGGHGQPDGDDGRRPAATAASGDGADPRFLRRQDAWPRMSRRFPPTSTC